jgi:hypothetical protein
MTLLDGFIASLPLCQFCANVEKFLRMQGLGTKHNGLASPLGR